MNSPTQEKIVVGGVALLGVTLLAAIVLLGQHLVPQHSAQQLMQQPNVVVQPLVVVPQQSGDSNPVAQEPMIGGLIHNTQESFDAGIKVNGTEVISSTGGFTLSGNVTSTSVVTEKSATFTGSASSQRLCAIRNTTGADRVLAYVGFTYTTNTVTGGTYNPTISQSATAGATGTTRYYDETFAVPTNGVNNVTPTSSLATTKQIWTAGNYINFLMASPTTTPSGVCKVLSF